MIFILLLRVFGFLCLACVVAWGAGLLCRKAAWRRAAGRALFGLLLLGSLSMGSVIWQNRPSAVWQDTFGYAPPDGISGIQHRESGFMDWETTYFKFRATPTAVNSLIVHGWRLSAAASLAGADKDAPAWWTPRDTKTTRTYLPKVRRRKFLTAEEEVLSYDPTTQTAYYFYTGLD